MRHRILVAPVAVLAALAAGWVFVQGLPLPSSTVLGCRGAQEPARAAPVAELANDSPVSLGGSWADVALPDRGPGFFYDVAPFGDRAVAVGRLDGASSTALIAVSDDGRTWRIVSDDGPQFSRSETVNAVATADGVVVSGAMSTDDHGGSAGVIWWSGTGERWQRLEQPVAYVNALASGPRGLLARAFAVDGRSLLGSSADGRDWRWTPWPANGGPNDLAPIQDGWIAVGSIGVGGDDRVPVVWRSHDGADWTCSLLTTAPIEPFGDAMSVYPGRATTLVMGQVNAHCSGFASCAATSAVWVATKDGSWRRLEAQDAPFLRAVAVGADGSFVALTETGVSRSDDGMTWHEVSDQLPSEGAPSVIAVMPWGLVGVGELYRGNEIGPFITVLPAER